jgi:hypothetical protein
LQARVLSDHQGLLPVNSFYEASRRLVEQAPQALSLILDQVADSFYRMKLIPRAVDVGSKVWQWKPAAGAGK